MTAPKQEQPIREPLSVACHPIAHPLYGEYCDAHSKVMSCDHQCAALWQTRCGSCDGDGDE